MQYNEFIRFVKDLYPDVPDGFIPLHDPRFIGNERKYLNDAMDSNFVSSVGEYVGRFEKACADFTGAKYAVATMNGTSALHIALKLVGAESGTEVITQPLTFIATCNAISYTGARPVFVDVDKDTMGMSPVALETFLREHTEKRMHNGGSACYNKTTGARIAAVLPMHTFGHPCRIDELAQLCAEYGIPLVEDAAESMGSYYKNQHTGTFGVIGVLSFNGNKIMTTGGGGMILTDDESIAKTAKHITTTGKIPHRWEFNHDCLAYNYRLTNLAAALGCGQIEQMEIFIASKRETARKYQQFFAAQGVQFVSEPKHSQSNYWLNAILMENRQQRDEFLQFTNDNGVMTRPIWTLMNRLPMYESCQCGDLSNAIWLEDRVVNIPSSVVVPGYFKRN